MKKFFLLLLLSSFGLFLVLNVPAPIKIQGDGVFYFSWLRSAVYDHDINFKNELKYFSRNDYYSQKFTEENIVTQTEKTPNPYAYGSAVLWLPFYILGYFCTLLIPNVPNDGYSFFFVWMINFGTWMYGIGAVYFMARSCLLVFVDTRQKENYLVWLVPLGIWLSTPWLYYQLLAPSMSHVPALFLSSLFLFLVLRFWYEQKMNHWILAGVIFLLCATRWQNIVFIVAVLPLIIWSKENKKKLMYEIIAVAFTFLTPLLIFLISQMFVWKNLYGEYLLIPQGHSFIRPEFHGMYVLFSSDRGLLLWSPFLIFAFAGMSFLWKRSRILASVVVMAFLLTWFVNGVLSDLGGGESFGARRFLEVLPFLSLPIVAFWEGLKKFRFGILVVVGICIMFNLFLMEQYRLGHIPLGGEFDFWRVVF